MNPNSAASPDGIGDNQPGFVRGKSITESIMLSQEITHGIKKAQIGNNVIIKLDMAKAYDRVSSSIICLIPNYKGFFMEPKGPQINHLRFADDVIIFAATDIHSLKLIMDKLGEYEHTSGQLINREKSNFMIPDHTHQDIINTIQEVTNFSQKISPITYPGYPLYIGRQRISYYSYLVEKISKRDGMKWITSSFKDILQVISGGFLQLPVSWPEVVDCIAKCNQDIRITLVMWKTPPMNKYKLNTDGSALQNPGKIGGGGILRDDQGVSIYAFVVPFGEGTNNQAEVSIPWRMHREANSIADLLAKHSHQQDIEQHYYTPYQLPQTVKGSYLLEKMGVHNFRRKKLKRIKKPP
ncbi:hypothetical protein MTR67_023572 [Solanum verrucosum]|uniref:Reverse transcriptase domain-containing protein n=1 Tax=Solanum verrucosum TaxID=315347 RepID=A0AAF0TRI2_SOLVR|nr:hypothetical protein MTR67_023572 [Solanum verrucosum]